MRKSAIDADAVDLHEAVADVARFVQPVLAAAGRGAGFDARWPPGGPWR